MFKLSKCNTYYINEENASVIYIGNYALLWCNDINISQLDERFS